MRGFGGIPDIAALIRAAKVAPMSIAEAYDMPAARAPLVPPSPPRAPDDMTAFGRMKAIRISPRPRTLLQVLRLLLRWVRPR